MLKEFFKADAGQDTAEYAIFMMLVVAGSIAVFLGFGGSFRALWGSLSEGSADIWAGFRHATRDASHLLSRNIRSFSLVVLLTTAAIFASASVSRRRNKSQSVGRLPQ
jgi:hypothetical protein